jgi:hypothetical protein
MKNMVFAFVTLQSGTLFSAVVHTANPPSENEWAEYMAAVKAVEKDLGKLRTIVFTDGGGPNSAQRKAISDFLKGRKTPVCLVSSSSIVRGITTALSWFNPLVNSVAPEKVSEAFRYLGIQSTEQDRAWNEIVKLKTTLGDPSLKSILNQRPRPAS